VTELDLDRVNISGDGNAGTILGMFFIDDCDDDLVSGGGTDVDVCFNAVGFSAPALIVWSFLTFSFGFTFSFFAEKAELKAGKFKLIGDDDGESKTGGVAAPCFDDIFNGGITGFMAGLPFDED